MKLKLLFFFFFLVACLFSSMAQKYTYQYDAAGNRIKVLLFKSSEATNTKDSIIDRNDMVEFRLYPNPTKGQLILETSGIQSGTNMLYSIWNESGQLVAQQSVENPHSIRFDLSNQPNGFYILRFQYGSNQKTWNILKQ